MRKREDSIYTHKKLHLCCRACESFSSILLHTYKDNCCPLPIPTIDLSWWVWDKSSSTVLTLTVHPPPLENLFLKCSVWAECKTGTSFNAFQTLLWELLVSVVHLFTMPSVDSLLPSRVRVQPARNFIHVSSSHLTIYLASIGSEIQF